MKSNKGITLTSLIIYIIGLIFLISLMGTLTKFLFNGINEITLKNATQDQYTSFISFITKDINSDKILLVNTNDVNSLSISFEDGKQHQYIYKDGNIYFLNLENDIITKKILLCNNVSTISDNIFTYNDNKLSYNFTINSEKFSGSFNINTN